MSALECVTVVDSNLLEKDNCKNNPVLVFTVSEEELQEEFRSSITIPELLEMFCDCCLERFVISVIAFIYFIIPGKLFQILGVLLKNECLT